MEPRYEPHWNETGREVLIGRVEDIDVYKERRNEDVWMLLTVWQRQVGQDHNYDCYDVEDGALVPDEKIDRPLTPLQMCELYRLAHEQNLL